MGSRTLYKPVQSKEQNPDTLDFNSLKGRATAHRSIENEIDKLVSYRGRPENNPYRVIFSGGDADAASKPKFYDAWIRPMVQGSGNDVLKEFAAANYRHGVRSVHAPEEPFYTRRIATYIALLAVVVVLVIVVVALLWSNARSSMRAGDMSDLSGLGAGIAAHNKRTAVLSFM
jgi:hypothetical protein